MSFLLLPFQRITRIKMLIEVSCRMGAAQWDACNRRELIKDQLSRQSRGYRDFISSEGVSVGI